MTIKLSLLTIRTNDLELAKEFYTRLLATTFTTHTDHGSRHYSTQLGSVTFEIYPTKKELKQLDMPGFIVDSLETIIDRMGKGYLYEAPFDTPLGLSAILKDPDGRLIYLTECHNSS